ncbi:MAG: DnaJ domain-containing protein, partial [Nitrospirota bacterium]
MEFKDYYKLLEVDRTATADDIKSAYRKLAR